MNKHRLFTLALLCLSTGGFTALARSGEDTKQALTAAFLQYLQQQETALQTGNDQFMANAGARIVLPARLKADKALSGKQVVRQQQMVWEAWQEANRQLKEEKLIPLDSLCTTHQGAWHLPGSLEPNATLPYYYGSKKAEGSPLPLFLYVHGSGPKDHEWSNGIALARYFDDAPCLYFIPQIPNEGEYYRWWQKAKQYAWEKLLRLTLASSQADADRLYVFGISEGGYGSQRLASFYADYWAAAGPMAGGEPLMNAPAENCANIGFSLLTGAEDDGFYRNQLTGYVKEAFDSLQHLCPQAFRHRIELIPHRQHHIDYSPTTPWLKTFTRNPYPRRVMWEDYDMDGRHRSGFYNLQVLQRPQEKVEARTRYDMQIDSATNTVRLSVSDVTYETVERDTLWGIALRFARHYTPSTRGRLRIYLNSSLVDLSRPVSVLVNGKEMYRGKVQSTLTSMAESCAEYFDPRRIYPACIDVTIQK